jgi:hypothetical protein
VSALTGDVLNVYMNQLGEAQQWRLDLTLPKVEMRTDYKSQRAASAIPPRIPHLSGAIPQIVSRPCRRGCGAINASRDPAMFTRFWLAGASAPLGEGKSATWKFLMSGAVAHTRVREIERRLVLEWEGNETAGFTC